MITLAVVLTPVASAQALAALCALDGVFVDVVPTERGAVVVRAVEVGGSSGSSDAAGEPAEAQPAEAEPAEAEWDISELVDDAIPAEAAELAARISLLTRQGVVLVTAALTEDGALDAGLSGQITARRYVGGDAAEDVPAGLVIAGADDVVEDLLLGRRGVADIPGHVSSADAARTRRNRWLGKGNRGRRP